MCLLTAWRESLLGLTEELLRHTNRRGRCCSWGSCNVRLLLALSDRSPSVRLYRSAVPENMCVRTYASTVWRIATARAKCWLLRQLLPPLLPPWPL